MEENRRMCKEVSGTENAIKGNKKNVKEEECTKEEKGEKVYV